MRLFLTLLIIVITNFSALAQSNHPQADSLQFKLGKVLAFKKGVFYRDYLGGYYYPTMGRKNKVEGVMSFVCRLDKNCDIKTLNFMNSLGKDFEACIRKKMLKVSKIYQAYEYQNCEDVDIKETINWNLGSL